jgi:1,4-alpha-glucan branching enzyme
VSYDILLSSDSTRFGGSGFGQEGTVSADPSPFHGYPQSVSLNLPPLGALVLAPR